MHGFVEIEQHVAGVELADLAGVEATRSFTLPIVGKGAAPNFTVHFTLHVTVNANGTVTAQVGEITTTCQG